MASWSTRNWTLVSFPMKTKWSPPSARGCDRAVTIQGTGTASGTHRHWKTSRLQSRRILFFASMRHYARERNSLVRVSTLIRSPSLMYSGTCTTNPVSSVAGLVRPVAEFPLIPGSHCVMVNSTATVTGETVRFTAQAVDSVDQAGLSVLPYRHGGVPVGARPGVDRGAGPDAVFGLVVGPEILFVLDHHAHHHQLRATIGRRSCQLGSCQLSA